MNYTFILFLFVSVISTGSSYALDKPEVNALILNAERLMNSDTDKSLLLANQALNISQTEHYQKEELKALITLSNIYWYKTDLSKALEYADKSNRIAEKHHYNLLQVDALLNLGRIYKLLGNFELSTEYTFKALTIAEKEEDLSRMSTALSRLGFNYFDLGGYEKALEYYNQSLEISRQLNDSTALARGLNNMAATYASLGIFSDFESVIKEAITINRKNNNKSWLGVNYLNLGSLNGENNRTDTAFYYFDKALELFKDLNQLEKIVKIYLEKAKCYEVLNNPEKTLYYLNKSHSLAKDNKLNRMIYLTALELHHYYLNQNDTTNAYLYSIIETQSKDSIDITGNLTRLSHLELLHSIEKKKHELRLKKQKEHFITQLVIISLVALLIFIFLLFLRYQLKVKYTRLKQNKLKEELDYKNRELATHVLNMMKRNEVLSDVSLKLKDFRKTLKQADSKKAVQHISLKLDQVMKSNIWSDFEKRFNQVHPTFYDNLYQKFPDLTPNEKRVCAFLKLNMSTKEISELTGQKVESLEKARTRLRKKLELTNTNVNLTAFLSQF